MIYIRKLDDSDRERLAESLRGDEYHAGTPVEFFYDPRSVCNVYEDEDGKPIFWLRGTKALKVDMQFIDNKDFRRNRQALLDGFPSFIENVRNAGFSELIFDSTSPLLIAFCKKHFGFVESEGVLRKFIRI